jgi:hypothetical protein
MTEEIDPVNLEEFCTKDIRDRLTVTMSPERTFIVVLALNRDENKNELTKITHRKSVPLGGYVYDATSDSYHVPCVDYIQLGYISVSFVMRMPGTGTWRCRVPMPETTLRRYMSSQQRTDLKTFKEIYKGDDYYFIFMQVLDATG